MEGEREREGEGESHLKRRRLDELPLEPVGRFYSSSAAKQMTQVVLGVDPSFQPSPLLFDIKNYSTSQASEKLREARDGTLAR